MIYYKVFYWTFKNYIQSARVASTGMIQVDKKFEQTAK